VNQTVVGIAGLVVALGLSGCGGQEEAEAEPEAEESMSYQEALENLREVEGLDPAEGLGTDEPWEEPSSDVGYDSATDTHRLESGLVVKSPRRWAFAEDVFKPLVTNESGGTLTPYFAIQLTSSDGTRLIASWDCYGDTLGEGMSQRVECFGEGTYRGGTIEMIDESIPY
jgi:hypothetical protein